MNGILNFAKVNAKAIAAFVAGLLLNAITAVVNGQVPWPHTLKDWGQYLVTSLIAGVMVWLTGNKLTQNQIINGAVKQGVTVITTSAINTAASAAETAVHEVTAQLPAGVAGPLNDVAQHVSDTVTTVLKGVAQNFPDDLLKNIL